MPVPGHRPRPQTGTPSLAAPQHEIFEAELCGGKLTRAFNIGSIVVYVLAIVIGKIIGPERTMAR
jgi:hypothetical protein